jgi:hypothetical protein
MISRAVSNIQNQAKAEKMTERMNECESINPLNRVDSRQPLPLRQSDHEIRFRIVLVGIVSGLIDTSSR